MKQDRVQALLDWGTYVLLGILGLAIGLLLPDDMPVHNWDILGCMAVLSGVAIIWIMILYAQFKMPTKASKPIRVVAKQDITQKKLHWIGCVWFISVFIFFSTFGLYGIVGIIDGHNYIIARIILCEFLIPFFVTTAYGIYRICRSRLWWAFFVPVGALIITFCGLLVYLPWDIALRRVIITFLNLRSIIFICWFLGLIVWSLLWIFRKSVRKLWWFVFYIVLFFVIVVIGQVADYVTRPNLSYPGIREGVFIIE